LTQRKMNTATESSLKRFHRLLLRLEDWILMLLLTAMILLASSQILLRNVFETGISWADPTLRLLVLWLSLLGAMAATRDNNHISIDLLSRFLSRKLKRLAQRLTDLFAGIVCGFLAWNAGRFVLFEWEDGAELFASLPAWVGELILPLGFGVMALRFLLAALLGRPAEEEQAG
jgi:TRAP-type C4-dicarboxylate transport system permease small subunit